MRRHNFINANFQLNMTFAPLAVSGLGMAALFFVTLITAGFYSFQNTLQGTFSKVFATCGGFLAASADLI